MDSTAFCWLAVKILGAFENATTPCSYTILLESFHGCGTCTMTATSTYCPSRARISSLHGIRSTLTRLGCCNPKRCNLNAAFSKLALRDCNATGCSPDCANRNCGPDGCGRYCGSPENLGVCPNGYFCNDDQTCAYPWLGSWLRSGGLHRQPALPFVLTGATAVVRLQARL